MPSGLAGDEHAMGAGRDGLADFGQVQAHRVSVAAGQDKARAGSLRRTDRTENPGRQCALILRGRGP